jgi:hypothetical protein
MASSVQILHLESSPATRMAQTREQAPLTWARAQAYPIQIGSFNKNSYSQLTFGQEMDFESPNQNGKISIFWSGWKANNGSTVWLAFDPTTGNWICNFWNVPGYATSFDSPALSTENTTTS